MATLTAQKGAIAPTYGFGSFGSFTNTPPPPSPSGPDFAGINNYLLNYTGSDPSLLNEKYALQQRLGLIGGGGGGAVVDPNAGVSGGAPVDYGAQFAQALSSIIGGQDAAGAAAAASAKQSNLLGAQQEAAQADMNQWILNATKGISSASNQEVSDMLARQYQNTADSLLFNYDQRKQTLTFNWQQALQQLSQAYGHNLKGINAAASASGAYGSAGSQDRRASLYENLLAGNAQAQQTYGQGMFQNQFGYDLGVKQAKETLWNSAFQQNTRQEQQALQYAQQQQAIDFLRQNSSLLTSQNA